MLLNIDNYSGVKPNLEKGRGGCRSEEVRWKWYLITTDNNGNHHKDGRERENDKNTTYDEKVYAAPPSPASVGAITPSIRNLMPEWSPGHKEDLLDEERGLNVEGNGDCSLVS